MPRSIPSLLVLAACLLAGCGNDGAWIQTWWGPTDPGTGESPFPPGGTFQVQGFVHRVSTSAEATGTDARDLLEVVLVGAEQDVSCDAYRRYLGDVSATQAWVDDLLSRPEADWPTQWLPYVCQELRGAAAEAFGDGGTYRAVHVLAEVTGGAVPADGVFRAAEPGSDPEAFGGGELLVPGSMVTRVYERSQHGDGILPKNSGGDDAPWRRACLSTEGTTECDIDPDRDCAGYLTQLVDDWRAGRTKYPDRASVALQAASHRYYHHYKDQDVIQIRSQDRPLGMVLPAWDGVGTSDVDVELTIFSQVSRTPSIFPYQQMLISTQAATVPLTECPELGDTAGMVWPEVAGLPGAPQSTGPTGDDDDSMGDDDDSMGDDDDSSSDDDDSAGDDEQAR